MARDQLPQELLVEPVEILDCIEDAEARPDTQEQRDLAETRLQVDDHGRALGQPRQLHRAVHRDGRGT